MQQYEWQLPPDDEQLFREKLADLRDEVRDQLWWCMTERGKPSPASEPAVAGSAPDVDEIVDRIRDESPGERQANWALTHYALLTTYGYTDESTFSSGRTGVAAELALQGLPTDKDWFQEWFPLQAIDAVGAQKRVPPPPGADWDD